MLNSDPWSRIKDWEIRASKHATHILQNVSPTICMSILVALIENKRHNIANLSITMASSVLCIGLYGMENCVYRTVLYAIVQRRMP